MKHLFLSSQAEQGWNSLRSDLERIRREQIPTRQLKLLHKAQELSYIVITVIVAVAIIVTVWTILSSSGMDAVTKMVSWVMDILKLVRLGV